MASRPRSRSHAGFTFAEFGLSLLVLGVVSAVAAPRYIELGSQTRASKLEAVASSIKVATQLTRAATIATAGQSGPTGQVVVDGSPVQTRFGYPEASADGIIAAIGLDLSAQGPDAVRLVPGTQSIRIEVASAWSQDRCSITYTAASASAGPSLSGADTSGC